MPVRIATLTEYELLREGVVRLLAIEPSFFPLVEPGAAVPSTLDRLVCDVVLLDSQMEGALARCGQIKAQNGPPVIFIGTPEDYSWCMEALQAGARGLVSTRVAADTLIRAIRAVHHGGMWVPEHLVVASITKAAAASATPPLSRDQGMFERLSAREAEVFRHAARGLCNKDLAGLLHITEATVKVHLTNIFMKLGLRGRAELAAAYHGIVGLAAESR